MITAFPRTTRWLTRDRFTAGHLLLGAVALLMGAWIAWALLADVGVFATSSDARLVVERDAHAVEAPRTGTVVSVRMRLGDQVLAGDVLVELDDAPLHRRLEETRATVGALEAQLELARKEMGSAQSTLDEALRARASAGRAAEAELDEARAAVDLAAVEADRLAALHATDVVSAADLERARALAARRRAELVAAVARLEETEIQLETGLRERQTRLIRLQREAERLRGELDAATAGAAQLIEEIGRQRITAPVDGRLAQVSHLRPGSVVEQGEAIATVLPSGEIRAVADFSPAEALGRIRPGQRAWLSLAGFPWTRFGYVEATVDRVAAEPGGGVVRVELALVRPGGRIPLEHGLPGSVEVEVERVAPWQLLLRHPAAGPEAAR